MLQIYVYGPTEEGFLDLDPETKLDMEGLSELFDEDLSTGEYSLPVTFPWSDKNRRLLGFAERMENFRTAAKQWKCTVYDRMFPELVNAQMTLLEKTGSFAYTKGSFNVTIAATKGLFGSLIKNKTLRNLKLAGKINFAGTESRAYAEDVMKGLHPDVAAYLAFAPVAIEDFIQKDRPDFDNEFLAKDTVNNIVITGTGANDWKFARPKSSDGTPTAPGDSEHNDYRTIPFLNLKYIVRQIFAENGYAITGDFLDGTDFDNLYIFNNTALEYYIAGTHQDYNTSIIPSNHLPNMSIAEFLKAVFGFVNVYPVFTNSDVKLYYRKNNFTQRRVLSLNDVCSNQFNSTYADGNESANGYKLNYTWDSNDGYYSDRVKDLKDKTIVATVATAGALASLSIGRPLTTNDIAFVEADNLYYVVADGTTTPIKWEPYAEDLDSYTVGQGERTVDINLSTLCTYVTFNSTTALHEKQNYVGTRQPGTYINNKGIKVVNDCGLRIFYIKKKNIGGVLVPCTFNHNKDATGAKVVPYSLAWKGADGMAANFHKQWQELRSNMEVVKTSLSGTQKVLSDMAANNCYEISNVLFLPYKTERTIPLKTSMDVQLVPM